jgi:hypothetical protein
LTKGNLPSILKVCIKSGKTKLPMLGPAPVAGKKYPNVKEWEKEIAHNQSTGEKRAQEA